MTLKIRKHMDYRIINIEIDQFAYFENKFKVEDKIAFHATLEVRANTKTQELLLRLGQEFRQRDETLLVIAVICTFMIGEEKWNSFKNVNKPSELIVPREALIEYTRDVEGISRGIIFLKTEGTSLRKIMPPPTDLHEMIFGDTHFTFETEKQ